MARGWSGSPQIPAVLNELLLLFIPNRPETLLWKHPAKSNRSVITRRCNISLLFYSLIVHWVILSQVNRMGNFCYVTEVDAEAKQSTLRKFVKNKKRIIKRNKLYFIDTFLFEGHVSFLFSFSSIWWMNGWNFTQKCDVHHMKNVQINNSTRWQTRHYIKLAWEMSFNYYFYMNILFFVVVVVWSTAAINLLICSARANSSEAMWHNETWGLNGTKQSWDASN